MESVIISLGGSIIVPEDINIEFLEKFRELILEQKKRFIIICGGGKTARDYQDAAARITGLSLEDIDWIGIHATRLNAHLLRTILGDVAHKRVIKNPTEKISFKEEVLVASGWKPGFSTDYDAVMLAKNLKVRTIINMTNVDFVYDRDPKQHKFAKPIKKMSWDEMIDLVGDEWDPGLSAPFDPVACKEAKKLKLKVIILNGTNLENLRNCLDGKKFDGTVIS
jgi:uridylate kinase